MSADRTAVLEALAECACGGVGVHRGPLCDPTWSYDHGALPSQWLAVTAGLDSRAHARQLRQSWERLLALRELKSEPGPELTGRLRQPIVESWKRSLDTGLDPLDLLAPLEADPVEMQERWAEHPLGSLAQVLLAQLGDIARESESLIVVSDASGLLLHIEGPDSLKTQAAEMNFVEGAQYSETAAGTNGIGTVLAADHALQVFGSEHFNQRHHGWACSGAPVHDPVSRRVLGVVDLSSPWHRDDPLSLEFPTAAAQALEQCLADARLHSDARLRRRYADLATRATDLLVSPDGYVLAGERMAAPPKSLTIPEGGGEILLRDGSFAAAEPLGHGEAYLVRRIGRSAVGAAPTKAPERADEDADEEATGPPRTAKVENGRLSAEPDRRAVGAYFEAALDCVIMADASGRVVEFNPAAERTFGYSRDEALGRTMAELIVPPSLRERHSTAFARFIETGQGTMLGRRLELTGMRADGSEFPVELALSQVEAEPFLICGALRDLSAAKQAERHLRELADEQAALRRVATLVARESSPQQLFAIVAEQVGRLIAVPLVRLVRYESDGSAVELIGGWGESMDPLALGTRWQLDGPGVLASVWRSGRSARLDDYTDVPGQPAVAVRQAGMRSAVASPIIVEGRLWGAIAVLSSRREPLPENTEARLADFTEIVATAIANSDARDNLRELFDEQAALRRIATLVAVGAGPRELFAGLAEEVMRVLGVPTIMLARFEPEGVITVLASVNQPAFKPGSRWPLDGPSVPLAVRDGAGPARIDDYANLTGAIADGDRESGILVTAGVPIIVDGAVWGVIRVGARDNESLPDDTEERLHDFTELLAIAIANAESRDRLRRLAEQQAALRRVATLVADGVAIDTVCQSVVDEIAGSLDVETVSVDQAIDAEWLKVIASHNNPNWATGMTLPLDGSSGSASVIRTGRPSRIDGYDELPGTIAARARRTGLASSLNIPVIVDGSVWGVIGVAMTARQRLALDTEVRLRDFASLLATAISNARAHERITRLADEQEALRRVATLVAEGATPNRVFEAVRDEVARMFDLPITTLMRYDADGMATMVATHADSIRPVGTRWRLDNLDTSAVARVFWTRRPARTPDLFSYAEGPISEAARKEGVRYGVAVPVVVDGALWGAVSVGSAGPAPPPADLEGRLEEFTHLLATAIANAESRGELAASRARVIAAADEARRQIERDLHDGAQQQLVTLALGLRSAQGRVPAGLEDMRAEVGRFADRLTSVVEELREMSRGIHPAILTEGGLSSAFEALALRSSVPVKLNVRCEGRFPDEVEVAAYYVVSEALTNAAKYADASHVQIDLNADEETLRLSILDDGSGGADPSAGSGLIGLKDRVEALSGTIEVNSPPGSGTRLDVEIPLIAEHSDSPRVSRL
jgi:PAS domain S-box-containing protein